MKPDWKDAPRWANYLAMDLGGEWWWYEYEPVNDSYHPNCWAAAKGGYKQVRIEHTGWKETLESRPTKTINNKGE